MISPNCLDFKHVEDPTKWKELYVYLLNILAYYMFR